MPMLIRLGHGMVGSGSFEQGLKVPSTGHYMLSCLFDLPQVQEVTSEKLLPCLMAAVESVFTGAHCWSIQDAGSAITARTECGWMHLATVVLASGIWPARHHLEKQELLNKQVKTGHAECSLCLPNELVMHCSGCVGLEVG